MNLFYAVFLSLMLLFSGCAKKQNISENENNTTILEQNIDKIKKDYDKNPTVIKDINNTTDQDTNNTIDKEDTNTTIADDTNDTIIKNDPPPLILSPLKSNITDINYSLAPIYYPPKKSLFNLSFDQNSSNYSLENQASFDTSIKRSGTRSIMFKEQNDLLNVYNIPIQEGSWYIISGYMYVKSIPNDVIRVNIEYAKDGQDFRSILFSPISVSSANVWEEFILPVYIQKDKNITHLNLAFYNIGEPNSTMKSSDVWIDDLSVYEVKDSSQLFGLSKASIKNSFNGSIVKVDSFGNFEVKNGDSFEPFFPIIIYPREDMTKLDIYKEKGFNTIVALNPQLAKKAVSKGMYWIWDLYGYGINDNSASGFEDFIKEYEEMRKNSPEVFEKLLYFYWDNERYLVLDSFKKFSDQIKLMDIDEQGIRNRPIYMHLHFSAANKNYYNELYQLIDLQGTYASSLLFEEDANYYSYPIKGFYDSGFANFAMLDHIPNVKIPKSVIVIGSPQSENFENKIFAAIARGATGFGYWRDGGSQPEIETNSWWRDFNQTSAKLQALKPLLKSPHWSSWELNSTLHDDEDGLVVGKRDFGEYRCIISASRSSKKEVVLFSLDQNIDLVFDYFTSKVIAKGEENSFSLTFKPKESKVVCWLK